MLLVASPNGTAGMAPAWAVLSTGGTALDAVETATRHIEDDPDEHTVGYGGYPNLIGDVELDASIMDGTTRKAGAVGALTGYRHSISVARAAMDRLYHTMLVGDGAARFAASLGLEPENLLTDHAYRAYGDGLAGRLPPEYLDSPESTHALIDLAHAATDPEHVTGTVNFIAQDVHGRIATAVSTSGWAFKYPGRLGDTPVIGAGNYADDRYGAATCMGWGELAIRAGTARSVVSWLHEVLDVRTACRRAVTDLLDLDTQGQAGDVHILAITATGDHHSITTAPSRQYLVWRDGMTTCESLDCESVRAAVSAETDHAPRIESGLQAEPRE